ncbi:hypothetical protein Ga0074812_101106 [Parafrankia irregularis]|uniref:Ribbon-helix-helix protein, copG family n=1 Tax=Parafrankia irregularis TaxID=795642 RepID=A0A0S4QFV7_9ACTN|nr:MULTISPECIES: hypothetical protein [Parafrankia]MBE3199721.1 hypothetical protein [Parafrankia sp. CH37]CUU53608.1 hypothetical protein Ga0074812_101106 [Parafrankia irregularis]
MITEEDRKIPRPYRVYKQRHTVDLTPEQITFMEAVREKRGASISEVLRLALDLWIASASATGVSATGKD